MPERDLMLIVGLGNPGSQYKQTLHNAGFLALDHFARKNSLQIESVKMHGVYCSTRISGKKVLLLKPQTFMNRSGESVQAFMKYFHVDLEKILVLHDDLDLMPGKLKMVNGGGAGGHNGIRSLIQHLGSKDFARFKIGIGHPRNHVETDAIPVERFVLSRFSQKQWDVFQDNLDSISEGINLFIESGIVTAMNTVNRQPRDET